MLPPAHVCMCSRMASAQIIARLLVPQPWRQAIFGDRPNLPNRHDRLAPVIIGLEAKNGVLGLGVTTGTGASQPGRVQWPSAMADRASSTVTSTTTPRWNGNGRAVEHAAFSVEGRGRASARQGPIARAGPRRLRRLRRRRSKDPVRTQPRKGTMRDHRGGQLVRTGRSAVISRASGTGWGPLRRSQVCTGQIPTGRTW